MNGQRWGLVSLFVGIVTMVAMWLAISSTKVATSPPAPKEPPTLSRAKAVERPMDLGPALRDPIASQNRLTVRPVNAPRSAPAPDALLETEVPRQGVVYPLDEHGIKAAIAERRGDLKACYETALFHTPDLNGTMTLVLQIEPAKNAPWGKVASVDAESEMDATVFEGCVATVFEELRFDAKEPTSIRYPVTFTDAP